MFIRQMGQGPDLVILHGWSMHSGVWQPLARYWLNNSHYIWSTYLDTVNLPGILMHCKSTIFSNNWNNVFQPRRIGWAGHWEGS